METKLRELVAKWHGIAALRSRNCFCANCLAARSFQVCADELEAIIAAPASASAGVNAFPKCNSCGQDNVVTVRVDTGFSGEFEYLCGACISKDFAAYEAEETASASAGVSEEQIKAVLSEHWLSAIVCHHAISPDDENWDYASCACSKVDLGKKPTVGEAVGTWVEHVLALLHAAPPTGAIGELVARMSKLPRMMKHGVNWVPLNAVLGELEAAIQASAPVAEEGGKS